MFEVFQLTLGKVGMLLVFIGIGYFMRRHHDLPDDAGHVLSLLCTLIFSPAYSISNMSKNFTMEKQNRTQFADLCLCYPKLWLLWLSCH